MYSATVHTAYTDNKRHFHSASYLPAKNSEGEDSYESCLGVARATVRGLELCRQINLTIYRMQKVAKFSSSWCT